MSEASPGGAAHTGGMTDVDPANPYAVTAADLERSAHVPVDLQVQEQDVDAQVAVPPAWEEQRRQARLAGGA